MAHCYTHFYGFQTIGLRFFTVYCPWGCPDMAMWLFIEAILAGRSIPVFNNGDMQRDFTYIDDIVQGIVASLDNDTLDQYEVFNLGNNNSEDLMHLIGIIENPLGRKAEKELLPMRPGDVKATYADIKQAEIPSVIPDIEIHETTNKNQIVEIIVSDFPIKPVACKGRYYKRVNTANHAMDITEVLDLHLKTFNRSWDYYVNPNYTLSDISLEKVNTFIGLANRNRQNAITESPLDVLRRFELVREGKVSNACFLMFMEKVSIQSTIELGRFQTETIIKDEYRLKTGLFDEVEKAISFIQKHINKNVFISGESQHESVWEYPLEAVREVVINAVIHRDYREQSDSIIKIFNDRIEIYNPGRLPKGIIVNQLLDGDYVSTPRNLLIADMFKEAGIIEKYGGGIKRILNECKKYRCRQPKFEEIGNGLRETIYPLTAPQKTSQKRVAESGPGPQLWHILRNILTLRETVSRLLLIILQKPLKNISPN